MEEKKSKKSYYLPDKLIDFFAEFCKPGRDYSPKVAAGILLYMVVEPSIREALQKLTTRKDIKKARIEARIILRDVLRDAYLTGYIGINSPEDREILLEHNLIPKSEETNNTEESVKQAFNTIKEKIGKSDAAVKILSDEESRLMQRLRDALGPTKETSRPATKKNG